MREGMRIFTSYTYKWKSKAAESERHTSQCVPLPLNKLKMKTETLPLAEIPTLPHIKRHKPNLPSPAKTKSNERWIKFVRGEKEIKNVAEYLGDSLMDPKDVGAQCFDIIHDETGR